MSDKELNIAIYWEVNDDSKIPYGHDFVNDPAWCVAMMEKHRLGLLPHNDYPGRGFLWEAYYGTPDPYGGRRPHVEDASLTRAVALAVLELTRRKE